MAVPVCLKENILGKVAGGVAVLRNPVTPRHDAAVVALENLVEGALGGLPVRRRTQQSHEFFVAGRGGRRLHVPMIEIQPGTVVSEL
jgi:hypothetical protein